ncbi:MAG TPA: hypothetical protein VGY76_12120 [Solirubrobacteraceae bacterium]|jgi:hypothetical protein|nr:hypothetical protein [Solirubrobacteraceae bacterium]
MNNYLAQLERALSDAAAREYSQTPSSAGGLPGARQQRQGRQAPGAGAGEAVGADRRSLRRLPGFAVATALLLAATTAAATIVVLGDRGSAPLTGTVPSLRILRYDVPLTPDLEAGHAGWCSFPRFSITRIRMPDSGGGTCSPAYTPGSPILLAGGEPISNYRDLLRSSHTPLTPAQGNVNLFWAIVTQKVAAIRLRPGLVVAATRDPRLQPGWKAVITFVSGQIDPVALDSAGREIHAPSAPAQLTRTSTRAYNPRVDATSTPCSIHVSPLPWVTAAWQVLATHAPALGSTVEPNVLFSCARSWYSIKGSSVAVSAAILLGARRPHRAAPNLPGLTATSHSGIFTEDGGASGPILAKRVGHAWLVVQGPSLMTDMLLLGALHAQGTALR